MQLLNPLGVLHMLTFSQYLLNMSKCLLQIKERDCFTECQTMWILICQFLGMGASHLIYSGLSFSFVKPIS